MSKGNSPIKVLRTALKRVTKGWTKATWHTQDGDQHYVCLEGAIYGYCNSTKHTVTDAQRTAIEVIEGILDERGMYSIPQFNDDYQTSLEDVQEVIKLGIIRLETGYPYDDDEALTEEETEDLLASINNKE